MTEPVQNFSADIVERLEGHIQDRGDAYWEELYRQRKDAAAEIRRLRDAAQQTSRGGVIWTICDDCGMKWADDRGGFKPHKDAPAVAEARAALASRPSPAATVDEHDPSQYCCLDSCKREGCTRLAEACLSKKETADHPRLSADTATCCACGGREECDHSCMPDVIDGFCSHCGSKLPLDEPQAAPASSAGTVGPVNIDGWKLVPDTPTEEMWQAGRSADINPGDSYSKVWRAMFNAAPNVDDCETTSHANEPQTVRSHTWNFSKSFTDPFCAVCGKQLSDISCAVTRPVLCPNGLEHGACLHPECVPSCPGRLSLSRPHHSPQEK
jgi:hypothetical protein